MAVTVQSSNTQTAVIGTEHTLDTLSTAGVYLAKIDCSAMQAGDVVELRVKQPVLASGTAQVPSYAMYTDAQLSDDALKVSDPIIVDSTAGACVVTLKQILGTGRAFPWSILKM
jgi:hypothetical protein